MPMLWSTVTTCRATNAQFTDTLHAVRQHRTSDLIFFNSGALVRYQIFYITLHTLQKTSLSCDSLG